MHDSKVEQYLTTRGYRWRYEDQLKFDQISRDANPARWTAEVDVERAVAIGIALEAGMKMPAIVCCETHTSMFALLSGRHRIEGCGLAKPAISALPAYVIEDVLDDYEMAKLPMALNCMEGRAPDQAMKLDQACYLTVRFPDRSRKELAREFGLRERDISNHLQLVAALTRAEELGVAVDMRRLADDGLRIAVNQLKLDEVFKRAVSAMAFIEMKGRAARGFIKDLEAAASEDAALKMIAKEVQRHEEELARRRRQNRRPVQTVLQRWRGRAKTTVNTFPDSVDQLAMAAHGLAIAKDTVALAMDLRDQCNEVIEKGLEVIAHFEKAPPKGGEKHSDPPSMHA